MLNKPATDDRKVALEYPQPEPSMTMNRVVPEYTKFHLLLAHIGGVGGTVGILVHPVPEPEMGATSRVVANDSVVWVRHPVSRCYFN